MLGIERSLKYLQRKGSMPRPLCIEACRRPASVTAPAILDRLETS
jgi:hypothetical protein